MNMVVGFMFDLEHQRVLLINKLKPQWQIGKLNGIGGKVEDGETPDQAMEREFLEEAGILCRLWNLKIIAGSGKDTIYFFYAFGRIENAISLTEEKVEVCNILSLPENVILNLRWLIHLCLDVHTMSPIHIKFLPP